MPQGPQYDSFNFHILVKIIDDFGGTSEYLISTPVSVLPNQTIVNEIMNIDYLSDLNRKLHSGDLIDSLQIINSLSAILNSECYFDKKSLKNSGI